MNEKMSSRQQREGAGKVQNIISRRSRFYMGEEQQIDVKLPDSNTESRTSSGDEMDAESVKAGSQMASEVAIFRPVAVDLGMDISDLFPSRKEERDQQVVSVLQAAMSSTKAKTDERPINFGNVVPGVYRSSFPGEEDFKFLGTLGLKTVLSLVRKEFPPKFLAFMNQNGIRHIVIDMQGTKKVDIPEEIMHSIMEIVLEKQNHPMLIHCNHGKHRTGCAVAVVRHIAGWNVDSIIEEYRGYAEPKIRDCDVKYITQYEVSSLEGLFLKRAQRLGRTRVSHDQAERMAFYVSFVAVVLFIWVGTLFFWQR